MESADLDAVSLLHVVALGGTGHGAVEHIAKSREHQAQDSRTCVSLKGVYNPGKAGEHTDIGQNNRIVVIPQ